MPLGFMRSEPRTLDLLQRNSADITTDLCVKGVQTLE